jgi:hypothetical protein
MPVIPALERVRWDHEFDASSLGYIMRSCLKQKENKIKPSGMCQVH